MKEFENNAYFWQKVDTLYSFGDFKLVNKKGSKHLKYPSLKFPFDFGYIKTLDTDEENSMEVFKGDKSKKVEAIILCADILQKHFEVKVLVGLNEADQLEVLHFLNQTEFQKTVIIRRGKEIPSWAIVE